MVQQSGDVGARGVNGCIEDLRETIAQVDAHRTVGGRLKTRSISYEDP